MSAVEAFLQEVDGAWRPSGPRIALRVIGSTALMLQTSYDRGTKDSDFLETDELTDRITARLIEIGGPGTEIHKRRGLYVDIVRRGVPFRRSCISPTKAAQRETPALRGVGDECRGCRRK